MLTAFAAIKICYHCTHKLQLFRTPESVLQAVKDNLIQHIHVKQMTKLSFGSGFP